MITDGIVFRNGDSDDVELPTLDPMVVIVGIWPAVVRRVLVDDGSSVNILFRKTLD